MVEQEPRPSWFERVAGALAYLVWPVAGGGIVLHAALGRSRCRLPWFHLVQSSMLVTIAGGVTAFAFMGTYFVVGIVGAFWDPGIIRPVFHVLVNVPWAIGLGAYASVALRGVVAALAGEEGPDLPLLGDAVRRAAEEAGRVVRGS